MTVADRLQWMRLFQRVAERRSFSAVARELGQTQSAVSKQVAALEQHLGARLLARSTHELSLTDEGRDYYRHCQRVLIALDDAEAAVGRGAQEPAGILRLSCSVAFGHYLLIPRLAAFLERHPGLNVDLRMNDERLDLVREGVDLAIRFGALPDSDLVAVPLGESRRLLVASRAYLARRGAPQRPADLAQHDSLVFSPANPQGRWTLGGPDGPHEVSLRGRLRLDSAIGVRAAVLAGLGIAMVPAWLFETELANGLVQPVLDAFAPPPIILHAVYARSRHVSARQRLLIDYLRDSFAPGLFASAVS